MCSRYRLLTPGNQSEPSGAADECVSEKSFVALQTLALVLWEKTQKTSAYIRRLLAHCYQFIRKDKYAAGQKIYRKTGTPAGLWSYHQGRRNFGGLQCVYVR